MVNWLAPILGVVVLGVIIELISKDSRLGKFVRAIYAFFVLFVIVQPLPGLLNKLSTWQPKDMVNVNAGLVDNLTQAGRQNRIEQQLKQMGYPSAVVCISDGVAYIALGQTVTDTVREQIQQAIEGEVQII